MIDECDVAGDTPLARQVGRPLILRHTIGEKVHEHKITNHENY